MRVFLHDATSSEETCFEEITNDVSNGATSSAEARVCLTFGADKIGKRGHLPRLFTCAEWDGHLSALSSAADLPFYSSSSSSYTS